MRNKEGLTYTSVPLAGTLNKGVSKMKMYAKWETDYLEVFFSADGEVDRKSVV